MLRFDEAIYLSFLLKSILSARLSDNLQGSDVLLLLEFINIAFIFVLYLYWIHLLYTFLVISLTRYKEYMIFLISLIKFSEILPAFTCGRAIGNLSIICLGVNILNIFLFVAFIGNIPLFKALKINFRPS